MELVGRRFAAAFAALVLACGVDASAQPRPRTTPATLPPVEQTIEILVNSEPLPREPAPRIVNGRILVPIVKIYAALGIAVNRNGSQLLLSAPGKRIVLQNGSARALIDDVPVMMDGPATSIDGSTYVPLRFVADSLGAQVTYTPRSYRVEIVSSLIGRNPALSQRAAGGGAQVVGTVSALDLNSAPGTITIERGGDVRTVAVTSDAQISLQDVVSRTSVAATLSDIHPGDAVSVVVRPDGRVGSVVARYASRTGKIAAVSPVTFVLDNGFIVTPDKSTQISLNSQPATLAELKVGDSVTVRSNPDTNEKRQILVSRAVAAAVDASPGPVAISAFTVAAKGALRAGDSFEVTLRGTPGGRATYDIGSYVLRLPLTETQAGVYTARYTVPVGVNFGQTQIFGRLTVAGVDAPRAEAPGQIAISTAPPQIVDIAPGNGRTTNNNRPSIFATYRSPTDVGINPSSVTISVNGQDVTASATRTDGFITYSPGFPLGEGPVQVVVHVSDRAGNAQSRAWSFTIRSR